MIDATERAATQEADWAADLLHRIAGKAGHHAPCLEVPLALLAGVGSGLRLRHWENLGLDFHRGALLPTSHRVLLDVVQWCRENTPEARDEKVATLRRSVFGLTLRHELWTPSPLQGTEVFLAGGSSSTTDEQGALLDAIAEFLWYCSRRN